MDRGNLHPTEIIDLFECVLISNFLNPKSKPRNLFGNALFTGATWSESDERSSLLQEKKDALLNQRTF